MVPKVVTLNGTDQRNGRYFASFHLKRRKLTHTIFSLFESHVQHCAAISATPVLFSKLEHTIGE